MIAPFTFTTALEYSMWADIESGRLAAIRREKQRLRDAGGAWFGPRHWVINGGSQSLARQKAPTACGLDPVEMCMAITNNHSETSEIDCPECRARLMDTISCFAAARLTIL